MQRGYHAQRGLHCSDSGHCLQTPCKTRLWWRSARVGAYTESTLDVNKQNALTCISSWGNRHSAQNCGTFQGIARNCLEAVHPTDFQMAASGWPRQEKNEMLDKVGHWPMQLQNIITHPQWLHIVRNTVQHVFCSTVPTKKSFMHEIRTSWRYNSSTESPQRKGLKPLYGLCRLHERKRGIFRQNYTSKGTALEGKKKGFVALRKRNILHLWQYRKLWDRTRIDVPFHNKSHCYARVRHKTTTTRCLKRRLD